MTKFYDALKALIREELVSIAAETVEEKESHVRKAMSEIISGFMAVTVKNGNTPQIENIFTEAGNLNILADYKALCREETTQDQQRIGDEFLQHLLGDKAAEFSNAIAESTGATKVAVNRLVSILAPIYAGYLGNKMVEEKRSFKDILIEICDEETEFMPQVPEGLMRSFNLSTLNSKIIQRGVDEPTKR